MKFSIIQVSSITLEIVKQERRLVIKTGLLYKPGLKSIPILLFCSLCEKKCEVSKAAT
jgi:hypothetical protein